MKSKSTKLVNVICVPWQQRWSVVFTIAPYTLPVGGGFVMPLCRLAVLYVRYRLVMGRLNGSASIRGWSTACDAGLARLVGRKRDVVVHGTAALGDLILRRRDSS